MASNYATAMIRVCEEFDVTETALLRDTGMEGKEGAHWHFDARHQPDCTAHPKCVELDRDPSSRANFLVKS